MGEPMTAEQWGEMRWVEPDDRPIEELAPYLERVALCWTHALTRQAEMDSNLAWVFARMVRAAEAAAREAAREEDVDKWQAVGDECDRQHLAEVARALGVETTQTCGCTVKFGAHSLRDIGAACMVCNGTGRVPPTLDEIVDAGLERMREQCRLVRTHISTRREAIGKIHPDRIWDYAQDSMSEGIRALLLRKELKP